MFHWRDGIYFGRDETSEPPGAVRVIVQPDPDGEPTWEKTIPPNEWASIVAAVSMTGETAESYQAALHYHQFDPADAT